MSGHQISNNAGHKLRIIYFPVKELMPTIVEQFFFNGCIGLLLDLIDVCSKKHPYLIYFALNNYYFTMGFKLTTGLLGFM